MILESFDRRTLSNMEAALERICGGRPDGADHELRSSIADSIVACARKGADDDRRFDGGGGSRARTAGYFRQEAGLILLPGYAIRRLRRGGFLAGAR
jgi:hypothetical protein